MDTLPDSLLSGGFVDTVHDLLICIAALLCDLYLMGSGWIVGTRHIVLLYNINFSTLQPFKYHLVPLSLSSFRACSIVLQS